MLNLLKTHFGYDKFLPLQEEIIRRVMSRKDAFVLMPTGGGKSLCYQLPALLLPGLTLVVSPLIALMKDQVDALKANGIAAEFINSSLTRTEISQIQARAQQGKLKIIYAAPERLILPDFQDFLQTVKVSLIAIDESHCISEWGHDFRPDYRNLIILRNTFPEVPAIALTATATPKVREDIISQLSLHRAQIFVSSFNRPNLSYAVLPRRDSYDQLVNLLKGPRNESAIIYCFSRKDTEHLAADLCAAGLKALPYHAGLESEERRINQEKFIRDEVQIIVATIAFGMGIDKPDVRLVIHHHLPKSIEGYYQETGRAGRDGLPGKCILFYAPGDAIKQQFFIKKMEDEGERENAYRKLNQMVEYCELATCRRSHLLSYFGEDYRPERCKGCDNCLSPGDEFDATIITQKVLSAIIRTGQQYGISYIIDLLRGEKNNKIIERNHDKLSVHAIVNDFSKEGLRHIISQLMARRLIEKKGERYPILELSQRARDFLKNRETIHLAKVKSVVRFSPAKNAAPAVHDTELFERLRALRKKIADEKKVPPFVIFGDRSLLQMALYLPQREENFARINGVGQEKLRQYGQVFMEVIRAYARERHLPEKEVPGGPVRQHRVTRLGSTYQETKRLVLKKTSLEKMASLRGVSPGRIISHIEKLLNAGEKLDIDYLRPAPERFDKIKAAFQESGGTVLGPVREILGGQFSIVELKIARLFLLLFID